LWKPLQAQGVAVEEMRRRGREWSRGGQGQMLEVLEARVRRNTSPEIRLCRKGLSSWRQDKRCRQTLL
jgi:hypothetical protein